MKTNKKASLALILCSVILSSSVQANSQSPIKKGPVRVGNGDNGEDLESFTPIKDGIIYNTRPQAVKLLKNFRVETIPGLGSLIPEVENAKLYMTKKGLSPKKMAELGAFTDDSTGLVYARSLPEPYASTRFFPAAKSLNEKQIISLHIHEALHRALPKSINTNEAAVTEITQSITGPDASYDRIRNVVARLLNSPQDQKVQKVEEVVIVPENSMLRHPSRFGFETRAYTDIGDKKDRLINDIGISQMYLLSSYLYPWGENEKAMSSLTKNTIVDEKKKMHFLLSADAFEGNKATWAGNITVCPLTKNWMMLSTWDKAHPFPTSNGSWYSAGGDYAASECVSHDAAATNQDSKTLYFDISDWYLFYMQSHNKNFGLIVISTDSFELDGDKNANFGPRFTWTSTL